MEKSKMTLMDYASSATLLTYSASAVTTPICLVILLKELNLNLSMGGSIETTRSALLVLVLFISGLAASRFGKVRVMSLGAVVLTIGLVLYSLAPSYGMILFAMIFIGLGGGLLEALINPLVQDLHPNDSGRFLNIVNAFWSIGVLTTVLVVGELLTIGFYWRNIILGLSFVSLLVTIFFSVAARRAHLQKTLPPESEGHPLDHAKKLMKQKHFWIFALAMLCGGGIEAAYTFWSASYIQIHYDAIPRMGAIGTALFALGMVIGRSLSGLVKQKDLAKLILGSASLGLVVSLGFFAIKGMALLFPLLFFAGLGCACFWPTIQSYAADRVEGDSTTLFILLSATGIPGFAIVSYLMGVIGDAFNLQVSFVLIPLLSITLITSMFYELKKSQ